MDKNKKKIIHCNNKIAHLGFIESTIERMANNSSSIKGWSMGITTAIIGLGVIANDNSCFDSCLLLICSMLITSAMWALDSFYLYQENLYRELYNLVNNKSEDEIDFSMDARNKTLKDNNVKTKSYLSLLLNISVWPLYSV